MIMSSMGLRTVVATLLLGLAVAQVRVEELTILSADRTIDISTQVVQVMNKLKIENTNASPTKVLLFSIDPLLKNNLAFVGASTKDGKEGE
jgi:hypothetical protein